MPFAAAIPALLGLGSSIIGGITGKGAAKRQEKLQREQWESTIKPLLASQKGAIDFSIGQARDIIPRALGSIQTIFDKSTGTFEPLVGDYNRLLQGGLQDQAEFAGLGKNMMGQGMGTLLQALPYLLAAGKDLDAVREFSRPFMFKTTEVDRFLPSAKRTREALAPEFADINQGAEASMNRLGDTAPRGGGRNSAVSEIMRGQQGQLSRTFLGGRQALADRSLGAAFQGAQTTMGLAQALQALGLGQGQLGLGTIGQGLNTVNTGTSLLGAKGGLAQNSLAQALQALSIGGSAAGQFGQLGASTLGLGVQGGQNLFDTFNRQSDRALSSRNTATGAFEGLGGYLVDLFKEPSMQKGVTDLFKGIGKGIGGIFGGGGGKTNTTDIGNFWGLPYNTGGGGFKALGNY